MAFFPQSNPVFWPTLFCLFMLLSLSTSAAVDHPTVYEALQQFDFPIGLLPKGAISYDLNPATSEFSTHLNGTCSFKLENSYELKYESTIKGVISKGRLQKLGGVSVKVLFMWLNIAEVRRIGDDLEFSVGVASANFPVSNFDECPQCGCGLDCVNGKVEYL